MQKKTAAKTQDEQQLRQHKYIHILTNIAPSTLHWILKKRQFLLHLNLLSTIKQKFWKEKKTLFQVELFESCF